MPTFGDADPEDAYDGSDPLVLRARVIGRVIESVALEQDEVGDTPRVVARVAALRRILAGLLAELD